MARARVPSLRAKCNYAGRVGTPAAGKNYKKRLVGKTFLGTGTGAESRDVFHSAIKKRDLGKW
jgi:hypothetical protein